MEIYEGGNTMESLRINNHFPALYQKVRKHRVLLAMAALVLMLFLVNIVPVLADTKTGTNDTNAEYTQAFQWVSTDIDISGAPPDVEIDSVDINWNIDADDLGLIDIEWSLSNSTGYESLVDDSGMVVTGNDLGDTFNATSEESVTLNRCNQLNNNITNAEVNGTWTFSIQDGFDDGDPQYDSGRIDSWTITINLCSSMPFTDAPAWAEDEIREAFCKGIVSGFPDGTYKPTQQVNRAQMSAFIVKAVDGAEPAACVTDPFSDVSPGLPGYWACPYIKRAVDLGIVSGFPDGTYRPTQIVNRGQMAAFIIKGMIADSQLPGEPADCVSDPFTDVSSGHTFCKYINELVNQGIASGFPDGTYRPTNKVNRAEMAVFVARAFLCM
jgi:hypothetical protein